MKANRLLDLAIGFCSQPLRAFRRVSNGTALLLLPMSLAAALAVVSDDVFARKTCDDGSYPPCNSSGEAASNNLSYPVIWSDGVMKPDFVRSTIPWVFAPVYGSGSDSYTDVGQGAVYCVGEEDIIPPETIASDVLCYYGRLNEGLSEETGLPVLSGDPKVWWLQQRQPHNQWQVFNSDVAAPIDEVVVTGVDTGDLLESSITIKAKQIRTEFTLLKRVESDEDFDEYLTPDCVPNANGEGVSPSNCFAALSMSGAVPGTDQSIAETQGTDFLDGSVLLDPRDVKAAKNYFDPTLLPPATLLASTESEEPNPAIVAIEPPLGMDATVYSACARLIIQKITGDPAELFWDSDEGNWMPRSVANSPCVDINAWGGSYSAEINAGGSLIYGYNWNTKNFSEGSGAYRLTFVLEGGPADEGRCIHELNTVFDEDSKSVNVGERRPATLLSWQDLGGTRGEGGAVYVDVEINTSGGGGNPKSPKN